MLSYTLIFELVPKDHKSFCASFINTVDSLTIFGNALFYYIVQADAIFYMKIAHHVGTVATILFLILIPESPRWLF